MNLEQIKTEVKQGFIDVDSEEYFNIRVTRCKREILETFEEMKLSFPKLTWEIFVADLKELITKYPTDKETIIAIGVYLNAIDSLHPKNNPT